MFKQLWLHPPLFVSFVAAATPFMSVLPINPSLPLPGTPGTAAAERLGWREPSPCSSAQSRRAWRLDANDQQSCQLEP